MRTGLLLDTSTRGFSRVTMSALLLGFLGTACDDSRFPVCKNTQECNVKPDDSAAAALAASARPKVCFDLRCVECAYDSDCHEGEVCSGEMRQCRALDPKAAAASGPLPGEPGSGVEPQNGAPRDPEKWEACVKKCADKACIAKCDAQYE